MDPYDLLARGDQNRLQTAARSLLLRLQRTPVSFFASEAIRDVQMHFLGVKQEGHVKRLLDYIQLMQQLKRTNV